MASVLLFKNFCCDTLKFQREASPLVLGRSLWNRTITKPGKLPMRACVTRLMMRAEKMIQVRGSVIVTRLLGAAVCFGAGASSIACAGAASVGTVEVPTGNSVSYGAPKNTKYFIDATPQKEMLGVTVYESSKCDVIPMIVMQRYKVTYRGEKEVSRSPLNLIQKADDPTSEVNCAQTYARNVEVVLQAEDGARYVLGKTDAFGKLEANLSAVFQTDSYAQLPASAQVVIRPPNAGRIENAGVLKLQQLASQQVRVAELLAEMESILAKGETGASAAEITQSYQLYTQLISIAGNDARVKGIKSRFWELFYGRKKAEALDRMKENLAALAGAKEALEVMGDAAIPLYVQAAVNSGNLDRRALEWSSLRLIRAIKGAPTICTNGFSYQNVGNYGWGPEARVAASYTRFAYGDSYEQTVTQACR